MKKIMRLILFLLFCTLLFPSVSSGQCDPDELMSKCAPDLGTYNYIKTFNLSSGPKRKQKTESSYVFSKGSTYMLIVCPENNGKEEMIINLFDKDHNLLASSFDEEKNKYYSDLVFPCTSTGVYFINATFKNARKGCGICILGLEKELTEL